MKIENIDIETTLQRISKTLEEDKTISNSIRVLLHTVLILINLLLNRVGLTSKNSSKPPSSDPNRKKKQRENSGRKPGGQKGHPGRTLELVKNPDEIEELQVDRSQLPKGNYKSSGYEVRQVFDLEISTVVKEYRAEILKDALGNRFIAEFPRGVTNRVQYGKGVKSHAVYLSRYQLLPYKRIEEYFSDQIGLPLSAGSISLFNQESYNLLEDFEKSVQQKLIHSEMIHADETGINIGGNRCWLHGNSNKQWTYLYPHERRGKIAMYEMGVLPFYHGKLCHDHWKPYYAYEKVTHLLCNAHHLRELERVWEQDKLQWGKTMKNFLIELNIEVDNAGGMLESSKAEEKRKEYRKILHEAERQSPPPKPPPNTKKHRGRLKRTKARNLLERLQKHEEEVLGFMVNKESPFTNNLGERDIRMTKVQQKISGCFRSMEGAKNFCRIRSYISSARKQNFSVSYALFAIFERQDIFVKKWGSE